MLCGKRDAGRFERKADRHGVHGPLCLRQELPCPRSAVPIDPLNLKLSNETYSTTRLDGMFGVLRDASLDS